MNDNMSYSKTIEDIQKLPHYREYTCRKCGHEQKVYILVIQANCEKCGSRSKLRGYASIGSEVEDVVAAALNWLGRGKELDDALKWKQDIDDFDE